MESVVRGRIAVCSKSPEANPTDNFVAIENVVVGRVEGLKQYINVLELIAIARSIEVAAQRGWDKKIEIYTDSQVAFCWARSRKVNPKVETKAHIEALAYLKRSREMFGGRVDLVNIPRELNEAGFLLEKK